MAVRASANCKTWVRDAWKPTLPYHTQLGFMQLPAMFRQVVSSSGMMKVPESRLFEDPLWSCTGGKTPSSCHGILPGSDAAVLGMGSWSKRPAVPRLWRIHAPWLSKLAAEHTQSWVLSLFQDSRQGQWVGFPTCLSGTANAAERR